MPRGCSSYRKAFCRVSSFQVVALNICKPLHVVWHALQGRWLVYGGLWTGEAYSSFHAFDFEKLAWSNPKLAGTEAHARYYHMAACHNNTLVILGGQLKPKACLHKCSVQPHFAFGCA